MAGPLVTEAEERYVLDAVRNGVDAHWNDYIKRFSAALSDYLGVRHVLLTSSCTGAMHIGLMTLGIGPGDEVIVPETTWAATASVVVHVGATPVFADVDPETWCIDPKDVERLITPRTRCIMPVHVYGLAAPMVEVMAVADKHGIVVLEDAAPAIGTWCAGRRAGTFGAMGAFSFQGCKLIATGQGGALVTNDTALYERAYSISEHGESPSRMFWCTRLGVNYIMSNVVAAFGLGQLEHVGAMLLRKREIFKRYARGLAGVRGLRLVGDGEGQGNSCWMTCAMIDPACGVTRAQVFSALDAIGCDTRPAFPALSQFDFWPRKQRTGPNAEAIGRWGLNLPTALRTPDEDIDRVCDAVRRVFDN